MCDFWESKGSALLTPSGGDARYLQLIVSVALYPSVLLLEELIDVVLANHDSHGAGARPVVGGIRPARTDDVTRLQETAGGAHTGRRTRRLCDVGVETDVQHVAVSTTIDTVKASKPMYNMSQCLQ